jgi:autotransporter translocation and assembly factor TamB
VGEIDQAGAPRPRRRRFLRRRAKIILALCLVLLLVFLRPVLLGLGGLILRHYAGKEHLKLEFRLEGNLFSSLTIRNIHAAPTGPTAIESVDADVVRLNYSVLALIRHGLPEFCKALEVRSARIVINPGKAVRVENKGGKPELPAFFPERLKFSDTTLVIRNEPHDFFVQHVDLELDPRLPGELRVDRLQLPDGQTWSKISARTSYANKNLVLRELLLTNLDRIDLLNIDASQIQKKILTLKLEAEVGGGKVFGSGRWMERRSSVASELELHVDGVGADALNKYADLPEGFLAGEIARVDASFSGDLASPKTWIGSITTHLTNLQVRGIGFDNVAFKLAAQNGNAWIDSGDFVQGNNHIYLSGSFQLPNRIEDLARGSGAAEITAPTIDLGRLNLGATGSATLDGKIEIKNKRIQIAFLASAASVDFKDGGVENLTADVHASKSTAQSAEKKPWFVDFDANVKIEARNGRYREFLFDSVDASLIAANDLVTVKQINLRRQSNALSVIGRYRLPENVNDFAGTSADIDAALSASELGDFWEANSVDKITGPMQLTAQIDWKNREANGQLSVSGSNLKWEELSVNQMSAQCSIWHNVIYVNDMTTGLNQSDFITGNGTIDPRAPFHYRGRLSAKIANVATLRPLLRVENELSGALAVNWEGSGEARSFNNSGRLKLRFLNGRYGDLEGLQTAVEANYSKDGFNAPLIFLSSKRMDFQTIVETRDETLEISKIVLNQGKAKYASGYVSIPFIWKNLGTDKSVIPPNGNVTATFQSENIDIQKLFEDFGTKPPLSGALNVKLNAKGTVADLVATVDVQMREFRSADAPKLEPATFDLTAQAAGNRLAVTGKLQQARIQPMELTGNMPFDIPRIVRERKIPDDTPLTGRIRLPRSSVNFLRQFITDIQTIDGDLAVDVDLGGQFGRPVLRGSADMAVNVVRFTNTTLPSARDFKARLTFAGNALTLERFSGELAGGKFTMGGRVTFPKITEANLDLNLKADSVLLARNDTLTVRSDADLKISGPLAAANVTGSLALTNSQFLKNIDLIPIGLPGRPAPQPPAGEADFSIPDKPLRDWKFDVAVKTKDPVLIRGNLATGNAISDLRLTGTGLHPGLSGTIRLRDVDATLPFSRLTVSYGILYFDPSDSFNPKMDMRGTSIVRDYTIHVYVYGTALSPQAIFTSEPPLPQEEIISLLATGTTRQELTGGNGVLAGRAAMLLVQQLYVKIFKKGQTTQSNSVFDRLDLDVGQVDPRTGQRRATARFKINDKFVLLGDLEVGGDFRGMVKYLIRFR